MTKAARKKNIPGPRYYALGWSRRILAEEREAVVLDGTGDQRPDYFEYLRQKGRQILERGGDGGPGGDRPTGGKPGGGNGD